jgi:group II intron reverse transcriptase/maturase
MVLLYAAVLPMSTMVNPFNHVVTPIQAMDRADCKALPPHEPRNGLVRSGDESVMSKGGSCKNLPQANSDTAKIMNLDYIPSVRPYTFAPLLLKGDAGYSDLPESLGHIKTMGLGTAKQAKGKQGPNSENIGICRTAGFPKGLKPYGNGSAIVGSSQQKAEGQKEIQRKEIRPIIPKTAAFPDQETPERGCGPLIELRRVNTESTDHINTHLIHTIADLNTLRLSYELIKSKPGNMTRGPKKNKTLDGTSIKTLQKLSKSLRAGTFRFSPARRIWIPKPGKREKRPLGIASPREKIVQKAIHLALESVYEPSFLPCSHGFRTGLGTHTALKMIDQQCKGAVWFIEADISKCFDSVNHKTLLDIIRRRVQCQKTVALIKSALSAGYVEMGNLADRADIGTPQGSVLSPLLCNIYLHELDVFVQALAEKYKTGKRRRQNPADTRILNKIAKTTDTGEKRKLRQQLRKHPSGDPMDKGFIRVNYVRYADDFIVSIIGPYSLAETIKQEVGTFLKQVLQLNLSESKTTITEVAVRPAKFLGAQIQVRRPEQKPIVLAKTGRKTRVSPRISFHAPLKEIFEKLKHRGFFKWAPDGKTAVPTAVKRVQNMDHADILGYYNMVIRGILNYYSFVDNHKSLGSVVRTLQMSCARTLALKYKLRFAAKVFKKFGKGLKDPNSERKLQIPLTYARTRLFRIKQPLALSCIERSWANKLTRSNLNKACIVCGATPAEMHHVRRIQGLKARKHLNWFTMQMAAINRKQVPLCWEHHVKLHKNALTDAERVAFKIGCEAMVHKGE